MWTWGFFNSWKYGYENIADFSPICLNFQGEFILYVHNLQKGKFRLTWAFMCFQELPQQVTKIETRKKLPKHWILSHLKDNSMIAKRKEKTKFSFFNPYHEWNARCSLFLDQRSCCATHLFRGPSVCSHPSQGGDVYFVSLMWWETVPRSPFLPVPSPRGDCWVSSSPLNEPHLASPDEREEKHKFLSVTKFSHLIELCLPDFVSQHM